MEKFFQIGVNVHGELKIREFDKALGREILSRDLTYDEIKHVASEFNVAMELTRQTGISVGAYGQG